MKMIHNILLDNQTGEKSPLPQAGIAALVSRVLEQAGAPACEVSILLLLPEAMRELNLTYRDVDAPTDVLSFPQLEGDQVGGWIAEPRTTSEGCLQPPLLGDVVLCPREIRRRADEDGRPPLDDFRRALVHGCLHLLGHDHGSDPDAAAMRAEEDRILENAKEELP